MSYMEKAEAARRYSQLRGAGLAGAVSMGAMDPNKTSGDVMRGYATGAAANVPSAIAAHVYATKAAMEQAAAAGRTAEYMRANPQMFQQSMDDLLKRGPSAPSAQINPYRAPERVGLRAAAKQAFRSPGAALKGIAKNIPGVGAAVAGVEGAMDGLKTPTEEYAQRNNMQMPQSTAGQVGLRALGVMQDVGNAALFGLPKKKLWR